MRNVKRFLTCRRGAVGLESAIAAIVLVVALAGIYEIVHAMLTRDLLARGTYHMANASALYARQAGGMEEMKQRCLDALKTELGDMLDFELAGANGQCAEHTRRRRRAEVLVLGHQHGNLRQSDRPEKRTADAGGHGRRNRRPGGRAADAQTPGVSSWVPSTVRHSARTACGPPRSCATTARRRPHESDTLAGSTLRLQARGALRSGRAILRSC